jgi:hypothetical protein
MSQAQMPPMDLAEMKSLVQSARWFSNLGHAVPLAGIIAVTDVEQWKAYSYGHARAEFGLPEQEDALDVFPFRDMEWLPTTQEQADPIHGSHLTTLAREQGSEEEFRAARLDVFRLAQRSLREVPTSPLLKLEHADYSEAARGAALFACRMAASEVVVKQSGFWCAVIPLYHQGHWVMGITPGRDLVVL